MVIFSLAFLSGCTPYEPSPWGGCLQGIDPVGVDYTVDGGSSAEQLAAELTGSVRAENSAWPTFDLDFDTNRLSVIHYDLQDDCDGWSDWLHVDGIATVTTPGLNRPAPDATVGFLDTSAPTGSLRPSWSQDLPSNAFTSWIEERARSTSAGTDIDELARIEVGFEWPEQRALLYAYFTPGEPEALPLNEQLIQIGYADVDEFETGFRYIDP